MLLWVQDLYMVQEEERHEALAAAREEEEHMKEQKKIALMEKQKEATIRAIRAQWEESHQLRFALPTPTKKKKRYIICLFIYSLDLLVQFPPALPAQLHQVNLGDMIIKVPSPVPHSQKSCPRPSLPTSCTTRTSHYTCMAGGHWRLWKHQPLFTRKQSGSYISTVLSLRILLDYSPNSCYRVLP